MSMSSNILTFMKKEIMTFIASQFFSVCSGSLFYNQNLFEATNQKCLQINCDIPDSIRVCIFYCLL